MFINTISNSKSDILDKCLRKFKYKYIDKYVGIPAKNQVELNFGSFIHKIFEEGYTSKDPRVLYEISLNIKEQYKVSSKLDNETKKCISNFISFNNKLEGETIGVELHNKIYLDKENDISYEFVIDRVIRGKDGGLLVIDYKTSKKEKDKVSLFMDKQLKGYTYAAHILFDTPIEKITCAHYYPKTNNLVTVKYGKADIAKWKVQEIKKVWSVRKKKKNEFFPSINEFCAFCEFIHICDKQTCPKDVEKNLIIEEAKKKERDLLKESSP